MVREQSRATAIVEEKDATPAQRQIGECNAGIYLASASFLFEALEHITPSNAQGEYYLTDLVGAAVKAGLGVATLEAPAEDVRRGERSGGAGPGHPGPSRAHQPRLAARRASPCSTRARPGFEAGVQLACDVELGPNVVLAGSTRVGEGTRIGVGCVITDSEIAEDVLLRPYSVLEEAQVGNRCQIGPFSRLRPGTQLADEVHLGNFVETKKARVGEEQGQPPELPGGRGDRVGRECRSRHDYL